MSTETNKSALTPKKRAAKNIMSPSILVLFALAVLLTGIIATIFGHKFGYQRGFQASQQVIKANNNQQSLSAQEVKVLNTKMNTLNKELDTAKQERDISLNNLGLMREDLQDLEVKNLQLQQLNEVYAETLSKQGGLPLQIVGAKIEPLPENAFEYRFDVAMLSREGNRHLLRPTLTLLDEENMVEVPLEPSTYRIKGIARIRGRFVMPKKFTPKQAKLVLKANGQEVEEIYDWQLSSPVEDMPISLAEVPETDQRPVFEDNKE